MKETAGKVIQTANDLIQKLSIESSWSRNMLSLLRYSLTTGEESPEVWGWIFTETPEELSGTDGQVSCEEKAIYLAMCLYANAGGGKQTDKTMVETMKILDMDRTLLLQVEMSETLENMRIPLYMLVQSIALQGRTFSFAKLAGDLYLFQLDRMQVIRKWEREII